MFRYRHLLAASGFAILAVWPTIAAATGAPVAVASIKPVHSLLAGVMEGAGRPILLVAGGASPHSWSLRPSDARSLDEAELVVWIGAELESFLTRALRALAGDARTLTLSRAEGVTLLPVREGGVWDARKQHRAAGFRALPKSRDDSREDGERSGIDGPERGIYNMHLWLDPENAIAMVDAMAEALAGLDPERAGVYGENASGLRSRLRHLDAELRETLAPVSERGFVVFHDAWQYFDTRYGLRAVGSLTFSPEQLPGASRLAEIRDRLTSATVECAFAEPQFEPRLIRALVAGTGATLGALDPLGAMIDEGPDLYFELMRFNAESFRSCFEP